MAKSLEKIEKEIDESIDKIREIPAEIIKQYLIDSHDDIDWEGFRGRGQLRVIRDLLVDIALYNEVKD